MALNIPQMIEKLLDTVNAGKVVTEIGAGLALSVPMLMLLSLGGRVSVLPADRVRELSEAITEARALVVREKEQLRPILRDVPGSSPGSVAGLDGDALYSMARREIAGLAAHTEILAAMANVMVKMTPLPRDDIRAVIEEKRPLATLADRLAAQKDVVEGQIERLRSLENQLSDARSFSSNIEVFSNNITATIAFAVVLGVVLSQVSRLLFVNLIYDRLVTRAAITPAEAVRRGFATQQEFDELIRGYYRFAEGSINMVAPALLFGIVLPLYAHARLTDVGEGYLWTTALIAILSAVALVVTGFFTYREYRRRVNALCTPLAAAPAPAAPPA